MIYRKAAASVIDSGSDDADFTADSQCPLVCGSVVTPPDGGDAGPSCVPRWDVIVGLLPPPGDL